MMSKWGGRSGESKQKKNWKIIRAQPTQMLILTNDDNTVGHSHVKLFVAIPRCDVVGIHQIMINLIAIGGDSLWYFHFVRNFLRKSCIIVSFHQWVAFESTVSMRWAVAVVVWHVEFWRLTLCCNVNKYYFRPRIEISSNFLLFFLRLASDKPFFVCCCWCKFKSLRTPRSSLNFTNFKLRTKIFLHISDYYLSD